MGTNRLKGLSRFASLLGGYSEAALTPTDQLVGADKCGVLSRITLIGFVSALVLACPRLSFAQDGSSRLKLPTAVFSAAAAADWATTYHGIKFYQLREANPLIRKLDHQPAKMVLLGGAIDIGSVAAWKHVVGRNHPKIAAAGLWTMTAFRAYLAIHNLRNQRIAPKR
jgi:hypothetical protein